MISFNTDNGHFNFRSVAVIIHNQHVLIHKIIGENFWTLPGGRVEMFETSAQAIKREISEELGLNCCIDKQLWHVESFYEFNAKRFHEIANYYLVSFISQKPIKSEVDFSGIERTAELLFRWVPIENIINYNLKPSFLIERLSYLPNSVEHININELKI